MKPILPFCISLHYFFFSGKFKIANISITAVNIANWQNIWVFSRETRKKPVFCFILKLHRSNKSKNIFDPTLVIVGHLTVITDCHNRCRSAMQNMFNYGTNYETPAPTRGYSAMRNMFKYGTDYDTRPQPVDVVQCKIGLTMERTIQYTGHDPRT